MKKIYRFFFCVCVFLAFMMGSHAWFTWSLENGLIGLAFSGFWFLMAEGYRQTFKIKFKTNGNIVMAIICLILITLFSAPSIRSLIQMVLTYYPLLVLLSDVKHVDDYIRLITKGTAVILAPGLILHFLYLAEILTVSFPVAFGESTTYIFYNFIFNLESVYTSDLRFRCVFLEPGYLGTLLVLLLYVNRFDFKKKYNLVLLAGLISSFSLAGYVTGIIAYVFHLYSHGGKSTRMLKGSIVFAVLLAGGYNFALTYNDGDNDFNKKILRRLELDDEKIIAGNNRTELSNADILYDNAWRSGEILLGLRITGDERAMSSLMGTSAGYKTFFLINGIIVTVLYLLIYIMIGPAMVKRKKFMLGFLILIMLTFVQAAYPSSYTWLIPYCLGSGMLETNMKKSFHTLKKER